MLGSFTRISWPPPRGSALLALATASSSWLMRTDEAASAADAALAAAVAAAASACSSDSCRGTAFCCTLIAFSSCTGAMHASQPAPARQPQSQPMH